MTKLENIPVEIKTLNYLSTRRSHIRATQPHFGCWPSPALLRPHIDIDAVARWETEAFSLVTHIGSICTKSNTRSIVFWDAGRPNLCAPHKCNKLNLCFFQKSFIICVKIFKTTEQHYLLQRKYRRDLSLFQLASVIFFYFFVANMFQPYFNSAIVHNIRYQPLLIQCFLLSSENILKKTLRFTSYHQCPIKRWFGPLAVKIVC